MTDDLLDKTVADGDRAGDRKMGKHTSGKSEEAQRAGTTAIKF